MLRYDAKALGYKDTKKAIAAHCRKAITIDLRDVGNEVNHPPIISAGNPNAKAIPESDVYRLIMRSKWSMKRPRKSLINNKSGETRCWHQLIRLTIGRHTFHHYPRVPPQGTLLLTSKSFCLYPVVLLVSLHNGDFE
ncbi:TPA: Bro-N domain-containing protein [Escherichia coli]|nr:Bro-N domain-containing protein [Escherichia coli]